MIRVRRTDLGTAKGVKTRGLDGGKSGAFFDSGSYSSFTESGSASAMLPKRPVLLIGPTR